MVRLLCDSGLTNFAGRWFQSHNGAIAAHTLQSSNYNCYRFNPTMVRLLAMRLSESERAERGFNPTMVRLLFAAAFSTLRQTFQSHNGAIAAPLGRHWVEIEGKFQSHNGAIAVTEVGSTKKMSVSIPQWCDCCLRRILSSSRQTLVSIPQWCDCC